MTRSIRGDSQTQRMTRFTRLRCLRIAPPKDIEKRTLKSDDVAGIVAVSPLVSDPKVCVDPAAMASSGCSCEVGMAKKTPPALWFAVLGGLVC